MNDSIKLKAKIVGLLFLSLLFFQCTSKDKESIPKVEQGMDRTQEHKGLDLDEEIGDKNDDEEESIISQKQDEMTNNNETDED